MGSHKSRIIAVSNTWSKLQNSYPLLSPSKIKSGAFTGLRPDAAAALDDALDQGQADAGAFESLAAV